MDDTHRYIIKRFLTAIEKGSRIKELWIIKVLMYKTLKERLK